MRITRTIALFKFAERVLDISLGPEWKPIFLYPMIIGFFGHDLMSFQGFNFLTAFVCFLNGLKQGHCEERGLIAMHPIVDAFPKSVTFCQYSPYVGPIPLRIEPIAPVQSVVSGWAQVHFGFVVRFHGPIHPSLVVQFAVRRD